MIFRGSFGAFFVMSFILELQIFRANFVLQKCCPKAMVSPIVVVRDTQTLSGGSLSCSLKSLHCYHSFGLSECTNALQRLHEGRLRGRGRTAVKDCVRRVGERCPEGTPKLFLQACLSLCDAHRERSFWQGTPAKATCYTTYTHRRWCSIIFRRWWKGAGRQRGLAQGTSSHARELNLFALLISCVILSGRVGGEILPLKGQLVL